MTEYIIRDKDGAIVCTGYEADNEEQALEWFIDDHPLYNPDDYFASES